MAIPPAHASRRSSLSALLPAVAVSLMVGAFVGGFGVHLATRRAGPAAGRQVAPERNHGPAVAVPGPFPAALEHDGEVRALVRDWLRENSPTAEWDETRWWGVRQVEYGEPVRMVPGVRLKWRAGGQVRLTTFVVVDGRAVGLGSQAALWYSDQFPE